MRRGLGVSAALLAALAATAAPAQDDGVRYWPLREINFPVPVEKIQGMNPRPAKLRLYVARDRGRFERASEKALADLDVIDADRNRKGFRYSSPADGEYAFALQFVYSDGDVNPRESELTAQYRVVFDTRPPVVRAAVYGTSGIEWEVQDDHPKPDSVELQVRWVGQQNFSIVTPRAFALRDRYTWSGLTSSQPLEVRVVARDRAGHEGMSRPITLPNGATSTGLDRDPITRPGIGTGARPLPTSDPDYGPGRPQIDYVNSKALTIESKLTRVTRSGVKAAHLWVNDGKGAWRLAKTQPVNITPATPDPVIRIPYQADKDGLYGFIVIPENGAGGKQPDPQPGDPAQFLIQVDTEPPFIKVKGVKVSPGGAVGPRVEVDWDAVDSKLMPEPVVLEYAEQKTGPWKPITPGKVANSGRYVWEVDDPNLWHFYVRAAAVDMAGNRSEHVYEKEVVIDLEKPAAVIEKVQGGGPSRQSERPATPSPSSEPPVTPAPSPVTPSPAPVIPAPAPVTPAPKPADGGALPVPVLPGDTGPPKPPGK